MYVYTYMYVNSTNESRIRPKRKFGLTPVEL